MTAHSSPNRGLPYAVLRSPSGATYAFDAGALCLQFGVTGGEAERAVYETLHEPADLANWVAQSPLGADGRLSADDVDISRRGLEEAKRLREAIWQTARRAARGLDQQPEDLFVLDRLAAAPPLVPVISGSTELRAGWSCPVSGAQVLSSLARDAIELFTGPLAPRIRECGGPNCGLLFVDSSRPGRRRWCSMQRCGNLHKQRAFRERRAD